jgi:Peptide methionine sulfoxide reductase
LNNGDFLERALAELRKEFLNVRGRSTRRQGVADCRGSAVRHHSRVCRTRRYGSLCRQFPRDLRRKELEAICCDDHADAECRQLAGAHNGVNHEQTRTRRAACWRSPAASRCAFAALAGGSFWSVQGVFQHVNGVTAAVSRYAGGDKKTAQYEVVGSGRTGHAESVQISFDPRKIS